MLLFNINYFPKFSPALIFRILVFIFALGLVPRLALCGEGGDDQFVPPVASALFKSHLRIDRQYIVTETLELKRLIRNDEAAHSNGNIKLSFEPSLGQSLEVIEAYTISPQGYRFSVRRSDIKTQRKDVESNSVEFGDEQVKVVIFPRVQAGSQLYVKAEKIYRKPLWEKDFTLTRLFSPHHEWQDVQFTIEYPAGSPLQVAADGLEGGEISSGNRVRKFLFTYKNLQPMQREEGSVGEGDYGALLTISSFKDWQELGRAYASSAKKRLVVTSAIREKADEITSGINDRRQQMAAIYRWVQANIKYVSDIVGRGGVVPNDTRTIFAKRIGDCKDHSLILVALLGAKGIDATTALVNSGDGYLMRGRPTLQPFNHAITYVPEFDAYLDATNRFARFDQVPDEVAGKPTLLTDMGLLGHTPSARPEINVSKTSVKIVVHPDGQMNGETVYLPSGAYEILERQQRSANTYVRMQKQVSDALEKFGETGTGQIVTGDVMAVDRPLRVNARYSLDPLANVPGKGALRLPSGMLSGHIRSASAPAEKPREVIHFKWLCVAKTVEEDYQITFPENVKVTRVPQDVEFIKPPINFTATYKQEGNTVFVKKRHIAAYAGPVCGEFENAVWKEFYPVLRRDALSQIFYE